MNQKSTYLAKFALPVLLLAVFFLSCKKDNNNTTNNNLYKISATASGANEVPAVTSSGTGTLTGNYDASTKVLQYNVSWSGLSGTATAAHFHGPAPAGQNATVVVPFTLVNNGNAGTATGSTTLTSAQEADLLAGNWYFNVHTAAHPGGEIRGQVSATH